MDAGPGACYLGTPVPVRRVILLLGAVLVLALGVYLFIQVRAQLVPPQITASRPRGTATTPVATVTPPAAVHADVADAAVPTATPDLPSGAKIPLQTSPDEPQDAAVDAGSASEPPLEGRRLEQVMKEANRAYDRGDFDEAKAIAGRVLAKYPDNIRMLRVIISASCQDGDSGTAQANVPKLPPWDQEQMKARCARFGVTLP